MKQKCHISILYDIIPHLSLINGHDLELLSIFSPIIPQKPKIISAFESTNMSSKNSIIAGHD